MADSSTQTTKPGRSIGTVPLVVTGLVIGAGLSGPAIVAMHYGTEAYIAAAMHPSKDFAWWQWPWGWPGVRLVEAYLVATFHDPDLSVNPSNMIGLMGRGVMASAINLMVALLPLALIAKALDLAAWLRLRMAS